MPPPEHPLLAGTLSNENMVARVVERKGRIEGKGFKAVFVEEKKRRAA
jgi:hypothetical protein